MTDFDDLKRQWKNTSFRGFAQSENERLIINKILSKNVLSTRDRLIRNHVITTAVCLLAPLLLILSAQAGIDYPNWIKILYTGFFVINAAMQAYAVVLINRTNYSTKTVTKTLETMLNYKKAINRHHIISILAGIVVISSLIYHLFEIHETSALIGAWVGVVVGGTIGFLIRLRHRRQINEIINDLKEILDENDKND